MRLWLIPILLILAPFILYGLYLAVAGQSEGRARTIKLLAISAVLMAVIGGVVAWQISQPDPGPVDTNYDDGRGVFSPPIELPRPDKSPADDGA